MIFKTISIKKSRTIGVLDSHGKTRFKKVEFQAEVIVEEKEEPVEARRKLSEFVDDGFKDEITNQNNKKVA